MRACWLLLCACGMAALSSCQRETQVQRATRDGILLVGNGGEPKALDPHLVTGVIEAKIIGTLLEGLVADDAESDTASPPGAATHWEHSDDYRQWTFHLRRDGQWSDGTPLTSQDFLFAYQRMLEPKLLAPYVEMLYFIDQAEAYNRGDLRDFSQVGVSAPDDFTLHFRLRESVPFLPSITRHYTWFPVPRHVVLRFGAIDQRFTPWCEPGNMVGNGAFVLKSWRLHDHIAVEKNPRYWNAASVKLNGVRFLPIENSDSESRAFLAGQLHTTYKTSPDLVDRLRAEHPDCLRQEPYLGTAFVRLNVTRPGLSDARVRRALALSIDRQQLCTSLLKGFRPARSLTPPMGTYQPDAQLNFDPTEARALLAAAGFPDAKGLPRYQLLIGAGGSRAVSEALQDMWRRNLNLLIDIKTMDQGSYISAQQKLNFDIALAGWIGDYLDPTTFLLMWTKDNGNNNTGWFNAAYEKQLQRAAQATSPEQREQGLLVAETQLMSELPLIPLAWQARNYLHHPAVKGWYPLLLDNHPLSAVSLDSSAPSTLDPTNRSAATVPSPIPSTP